jgi:DNA-binding transcriptional ArsR family regulator
MRRHRRRWCSNPTASIGIDVVICPKIRYHRRMSMKTADSQLAQRRGAALFHGLADRNRLAIVRDLVDGEKRVVELTKGLGLAQGTVSGHLACLRDCGLIVGRPEGRQMFYSIAHPELIDLLGAAEQLLALTGDAVELCPNYGSAAKSLSGNEEVTS